MTDQQRLMICSALDGLWAIAPSELDLVVARLMGNLSALDVAASMMDRRTAAAPVSGPVAVLQVYGILTPKQDWFNEFFGGTSFDTLSARLAEAMGNAAITTIVLDINSPGGSVAGATEFAREILRARTRKTIVAQIQYTCASAAYWLAAAASKIIAAPSAQIGSVGVYCVHDDVSQALAKFGITRTYIAAGEGKVDGNEAEPLTDDARARLQAVVNTNYDRMVGDIVLGRGHGLTAETVRDEWKALIYGADEARAIGMTDATAPLSDTLARLQAASADPADRRAALTFLAPDDPPQEPGRATGEDRPVDALWQHTTDATVRDLRLSAEGFQL